MIQAFGYVVIEEYGVLYLSSRIKRYARAMKSKAQVARLAIVILGVALLVMKAWIWRHSVVFGDIIQYLDMGDYFFSGQLDKAVSACWSPLYPIALGVFLKTFGVSAQAVIGGMRLFNCLVTVGCFVSFLVMFRTLRYYILTQFRKHQDLRKQLPSASWLTTAGIAVGTFVFCGLGTPAVDTPDMLTALILCWCFNALLACLIKPGRRNAVALGLSLAVAYLCNAVAFVMLPLFVFVLWRKTKRRRLCAAATAAFLAVALPWILAISLKQGSPTISSRWFATYVKTALAVTPYNSSTYFRSLRHPPGVICVWPRVLDFGASDGTSPQSWDINRWVDGMPFPMMPDVIFVMLVSNVWFYFRTFLLMVCLVVLIPHKHLKAGPSRRAVMSTRVITLIPAVMLVLFALSTNMYIYGFSVRFVLVPILLLMIVAVVIPQVRESAPVSWRLNSASVAMTAFVSFAMIWQGILLLPMLGRSSSNLSNAVASSLLGLGIKPGAQYAYITSNDQLWAREVEGRATTAIFVPASFFALDDHQRTRLTDRLRYSNIEAIVYVTEESEYVSMSPLEEDGRAIEFVTRQDLPKILKEDRPAPPKSQGWLQVTGQPVYILLLKNDFDEI